MASDPKTYQFDLPTTNRPTDVSIPETWYPGIRNYWSECTTQRDVHPIDGIKAVVIHATAGASSEGAISVMRAGTASFHWLVPDENEPQHGQLIWACAPETLAAWHVRNQVSHPDVNAGKTRVNHWSLGIEVVNTQAKADTFSDWQVAITAKIVRYCWAKYPNLRHIVSHAKLDPTRRSDPGVNFPWDKFKDLVLSSNEHAPFAAFTAATRNADDISPSAGDSNCCF
ncbi:MAG: N-acetylmuramoyl-L-alanine amidase [Microcoleus vaginatus WJT46-NPBG5]|nr:N-acetylmuramoyl-L-alanine amidase [Microcoleus vaginatus WJT46-NPBG5]